jgi:hypothetical protein
MDQQRRRLLWGSSLGQRPEDFKAQRQRIGADDMHDLGRGGCGIE